MLGSLNYISSPSVSSSESSMIEEEVSTFNTPHQQEDDFKDLKILSTISKSKFMVVLAESAKTNKKYAMKLIPTFNGEITQYFNNEIKLAHLTHPNIITPSFYDADYKVTMNMQSKNFSVVLNEFAEHSDFFEALITNRVSFSEKMARTYFHQLLNGLEYLHASGYAHLDLKLENLVLDKNFNLKIIDFDLSYDVSSLETIRIKGTKSYRAPELFHGTCVNPMAADVYSVAVVMFLLMSGGVHPYIEGKLYDGLDYYKLLQTDLGSFWKNHQKIQGSKFKMSEDFKNLFESMTRASPSERITIGDIKNSNWFNGEVFTQAELAVEMKRYY